MDKRLLLLNFLEICRLKMSDFRSLYFVIDHLFMKLFKTSNMNTVIDCQQFLTLSYHSC